MSQKIIIIFSDFLEEGNFIFENGELIFNDSTNSFDLASHITMLRVESCQLYLICTFYVYCAWIFFKLNYKPKILWKCSCSFVSTSMPTVNLLQRKNSEKFFGSLWTTHSFFSSLFDIFGNASLNKALKFQFGILQRKTNGIWTKK